MPLAGKTGTSQNYSDAWFIGYNPNIVIASRVGANSPNIHFNNGNGSGSKLALPLVAKTLKKVDLIEKYNKAFTTPSDTILSTLDCDDFKTKSDFEKFFDLFKKKSKNFKKSQEKTERKKSKESIFNRIFKGKNKRKVDSTSLNKI